jgi:transposase InsO family protein
MKELASTYPVQELAEVLEVSRSGYYRWRRRTESQRARTARELTLKIANIHEQSRQRYGSPRVFQQLRRDGVRTSENRVTRLMKAAGLQARKKRPFRPRTTDSNHANPIAPNRLKEAEPPTAPNQVWVVDITYIWTLAGWIYLAAVMDLFSRRIVGWALSDNMETP